MRALGLSRVDEAGEYEKLTPGGYVCTITNVEDVRDKEYLRVDFDVSEGKFKDYYKRLNEAKNFWGGRMVRSYKESALPFFKSMITAIRKSNSYFKWSDDGQNDEKNLLGMKIGLIFGEEEYIGNDGTKKTRLYVSGMRSVESIRANDFIVPDLKVLKEEKDAPAKKVTPIDDDDLPF